MCMKLREQPDAGCEMGSVDTNVSDSCRFTHQREKTTWCQIQSLYVNSRECCLNNQPPASFKCSSVQRDPYSSSLIMQRNRQQNRVCFRRGYLATNKLTVYKAGWKCSSVYPPQLHQVKIPSSSKSNKQGVASRWF